MTRDEIVTALRCCADIDGEFECSTTCAFFKTSDELGDCCTKKNVVAADLIENQQRHIEVLCDTVRHWNNYIEKLAADRKALINELCQYCGKYKKAHEGACDGCKWREM